MVSLKTTKLRSGDEEECMCVECTTSKVGFLFSWFLLAKKIADVKKSNDCRSQDV